MWMDALGGAWHETAFAPGPDLPLPHDPRYGIFADPLACGHPSPIDTGAAIGRTTLGVNLVYFHRQVLPALALYTGRTVTPGVKATGAHLPHPAHPPHLEYPAILVDPSELHDGSLVK